MWPITIRLRLGGVDPNLADAPLPDLTGNLRREVGSGHLQLSGVLRKLRYEGGAGEDEVAGWGLALSGKTPVGPRGRRLMAQVSVGEGTGEYSQALRDDGQSDAFLGADGRLEALGNTTATVGVENDWGADWWISDPNCHLAEQRIVGGWLKGNRREGSGRPRPRARPREGPAGLTGTAPTRRR